jgi:pantoate--beta-alanine ligase
MTQLVTTRAELTDLEPTSELTAVVMTMGALHDGHGHLMDVARDRVGEHGRVIVTDFVNPRQFGDGEDFDRYPRDITHDLAVCTDHGVDIVYAPGVDEVYPSDSAASAISIQPGPLGDILEGALRPGHFSGVLTVVAKLLHVTAPDIALFGEKDYQQLVLIQAMARALDWPVRIEPVPTVREPDGLAMSSRNRYLDPAARELAAQIPAAITAGISVAVHGAAAVERATREHLDRVGLTPDYVTVTDPDLGPAPQQGPARLLVAVPVTGTRLLDNAAVHLAARPELNE